jgi:hypothetical protein
MADRASAEIFGKFFTILATDPTEQHLVWAKKLFRFSKKFDFCNEQMGCDKALATLKLIRVRKSRKCD